jgi:hypothetical protein
LANYFLAAWLCLVIRSISPRLNIKAVEKDCGSLYNPKAYRILLFNRAIKMGG